ncbi:hypothetical protein Aduo_014426 [Ancylostoma duodenale]
MLSAGLLLLLFNILGMVTSRKCIFNTGTYPDPNSVLDPLAELIEKKVPGASNSCAMEQQAYFKFVKLTDEQWQKVYSNVKFTKELKYETEKGGYPLKNPEGLAKEAVQNWSSDLAGMNKGRFGCIIQHKPNGSKTAYKLACLFK